MTRTPPVARRGRGGPLPGLRIATESPTRLAEYARVPIAFEVRAVLDTRLAPSGSGDFVLTERKVPTRWLKDYDAIPDAAPESWAEHFDMSTWTLFVAYRDATRVGGAAAVMPSADPEATDMLDGRNDLALLWDIRVAPAVRGRGVGSALLGTVESWALDRGATCIKVETQDINVPACRFYQRHGFQLRAALPNAYPAFPDEAQLLWYKELGGG